MSLTFVRQSAAVTLALLWATVGAAVAQPSWYRNPDKGYPRDQYLVGRGEAGAATEPDSTQRRQLAGDNARADLVRAIRTHIQAEFASQVAEVGGRVDAYARSRVASTVSLEVDGIEVVKLEDSRGTAYALAVLPKQEGRLRHGQKLADLEQEIDQGFREARALEEARQTEAALRAYLRLYSLLARRDETQAVLRALGNFSQPAFQEREGEEGTAAAGVAGVAAAIDRLTTGSLRTVEDAAVALAFRLGVQLTPGQRVLVRPFTYGETQFSSPLSRYLARVLDDKLADAGLQTVQPPARFEPRGADAERELGRQAGADLMVRGSYVVTGGTLRVFAQAVELPAGRKAGAAQVEIDTSLAVQAGLDFRPQNYQQALSDAGVFGQGELLSGSLRVEAWTDRGVDNVVLEEGEKVTVGVRVNGPCYLQVTYHLANGKRALLYGNYYIDAAKVNHAVTLPDTFLVSEPLGVEVLQVFASTQSFPEVRVVGWQGYQVLAEDLEEYVVGTRGLKRQEKAREVAEVRLTVTTVPRR